MRDPHFVERGLFAHQVESASGKTMPALPLPIAPEFRDKPGAKKAPPCMIRKSAANPGSSAVSAAATVGLRRITGRDHTAVPAEPAVSDDLRLGQIIGAFAKCTVGTDKERRNRDALIRIDMHLKRFAAHQPRLRGGGRTPSRMTARRSGPMRSIM